MRDRARARAGTKGARWAAERAGRVLARCRALERATRAPRRRAAWPSSPRPDALRERGEVPAAEAACLRAFQAYPASGEARLCAARESLRAGRPEAARALARAVLEGEGEPWLRPFARLALARALEAEGARERALAAYRRAWEAPSGVAACAPRRRRAIGRLDRDDPSRGAAAGALRGAASVSKLPYKNHSSRPVPHIFVAHGGRPLRTVGSWRWCAQNGSRSHFERFPHGHAQPNPLHAWSIGRRARRKCLTRTGGVPTLPLVCEAL